MRMMFLALATALAAFSPAQAAERRYSIASFERIRVEGPFAVTVVTGKPAGGTVVSDEQTLERMSLDVEGTTLIVRLSSVKGWGERAARDQRIAPVVTLSTPRLRAALAVAGATLTIAPQKVDRLDVSVNGAGSISAEGVDADQVVATVIGNGRIALAGAARAGQLLSNGSGSIDAARLQVGDLTVRLEGTGETRAAARYTANVTTSGLGRVVVSGKPKCRVRALSGGPVICEGVRD